MNDSPPAVPAFATLAADPEIAPLLEFEPARRKVERPDGWTAELQRELIARIAHTGSPGAACDAMDKNLSGAKHLYRSDGAESFRQAWKAAIALGASRKRAERAALPPRPFEVPGIASRGKLLASAAGPLPGQVMNEHGQWEDEAAFLARGEEAKRSICEKLLRCRRLFLAEISGSAGKRAAFEILTELPIDWDKARRLEPQPDEPWKSSNQHQPDMILTAESGWSFGQIGYGEDKMKALQEALNQHLIDEGHEPVDWSEEDSIDNKPLSPSAGEGGEQREQGEGAKESDRSSRAEPAPSSSRRSRGSPKRLRKPGPRVRRV